MNLYNNSFYHLFFTFAPPQTISDFKEFTNIINKYKLKELKIIKKFNFSKFKDFLFEFSNGVFWKD